MRRDSSPPYRTRKVGWVAFHGFHPSTPPRKDRVPGTPDRGFFENADVDVRGTAGLETGATFMHGCEPKGHG
jgi:hypothetical protein